MEAVGHREHARGLLLRPGLKVGPVGADGAAPREIPRLPPGALQPAWPGGASRRRATGWGRRERLLDVPRRDAAQAEDRQQVVAGAGPARARAGSSRRIEARSAAPLAFLSAPLRCRPRPATTRSSASAAGNGTAWSGAAQSGSASGDAVAFAAPSRLACRGTGRLPAGGRDLPAGSGILPESGRASLALRKASRSGSVPGREP